MTSRKQYRHDFIRGRITSRIGLVNYSKIQSYTLYVETFMIALTLLLFRTSVHIRNAIIVDEYPRDEDAVL